MIEALAKGLGNSISGGFDVASGAINYGLSRNQSYDQLSLDPRLKDLQAQTVAQAESFQNNLPGYQQNLYNQAENSGRLGLAQKMAGIKASANSRGLLYSGLKQGQEATAGGENAANLARQRAGINEQSQAISNRMNQSAIQSGLEMQGAQQQMADQNYQTQLGQAQQKQQAAKGLISGFGRMLGGSAA